MANSPPSVPQSPLPSKPPSRTPRAKPDPRPARMMVGAGALAAMTVIGAGLVRFPVAADELVAVESKGSDRAEARQPKATRTRITSAKRQVRYVRLKPGQRAPRGAKVIREAAPTPRVVILRVAQAAPAAGAAQQPRATRRVVTRTRQSG